MKLFVLLAFLMVLALPALTQAAPAPTPRTLEIKPDERQFFALGMTLARGAFAYAELAKSAAAVAKTRSKLAQVRQLARLDPVAGRDRATARRQLAQAETLMHRLDATDSALASISAAGTRLAGPLPMTADAQPLILFSRPAARTVSSLTEFETLSSLPDDPALRQWLTAPAQSRSAAVWYAEGEIAGLSQIAAAQDMPDLLPPTVQIATDLRGLRDWLALRLPETPSPEQAGLRHDVDAFLEQTASAAQPGAKSRRISSRLSSFQLQALGSISRQVQFQVLGPPSDPSALSASRW